MIITFNKDCFIEECCNCHVQFGITMEHHNRLVAEKETFYCPNGHSMNYLGESATAKAKRLAAELSSVKLERDVAVKRLSEKPKRGRPKKEVSPAK